MALRLHSLPVFCSQTRRQNPKHRLTLQSCQTNYMSNTSIASAAAASSSQTKTNNTPTTTKNVPANYSDRDYLKLLRSDYEDEKYQKQVEALKSTVRDTLMFDNSVVVAKLEIIDAIQRLGIGHHFQDEIKTELMNVFVDHRCLSNNHHDLYTTSLLFRLLRQHGYHVSQDSFKRFRDEMGNFKENLCEDVKGMLSLYEASHLALEGETIMEEAKTFTTKHLKHFQIRIYNINAPTSLVHKVAHSLQLPLHHRIPRIEARWYIHVYGSQENMIPALHQLAKLDFNILQGTYQNETSNIARWWNDLGLHKLNFVRDKMMMNVLWWISIIYEPQFGRCREELTKITVLLTAIDDMYDNYVSMDDLELFTDAVERWNASAIEQLPLYMKIVYMALLNLNSSISYEILKEQGYDITPHQKKAWCEICRAFLVEAKWSIGVYKPTLKEYLDVTLCSIGVPLTMMYCYILTAEPISKEAVEQMELLHSLVYLPSMSNRLADDLYTAKDEVNSRGVVQCYMDELGITEEAAREHVRQLIAGIWKKMNKALAQPHPFSDPLPNAAMNCCRVAHYFMVRDDHGKTNASFDDPMALLFEPFPLK